MYFCLEDIEETVSADLLPSLRALEHCPSIMTKSTDFCGHVDAMRLSYVGLGGTLEVETKLRAGTKKESSSVIG